MLTISGIVLMLGRRPLRTISFIFEIEFNFITASGQIVYDTGKHVIAATYPAFPCASVNVPSQISRDTLDVFLKRTLNHCPGSFDGRNFAFEQRWRADRTRGTPRLGRGAILSIDRHRCPLSGWRALSPTSDVVPFGHASCTGEKPTKKKKKPPTVLYILLYRRRSDK